MVEYRYDAYGNITHQSSTSGVASANPYRYRGYRYDPETKLYYLNSRYYNPQTGRFINADGMLKSSDTTLGFNLFAYTRNNPVMYTDSTGYFAITTLLITLAIGAVIGGVSGGVSAMATDGNVAAGIGSGVVNGLIMTTGMAVAVATGGLGGLAIAAVSGFSSGFLGDMTYQGIDVGINNWDRNQSLKVGAIGAAFAIVSYGMTSLVANSSVGAFEDIVPSSNLSWLSRIGYSLEATPESFMMTLMFGVPNTIGNVTASSIYTNTSKLEENQSSDYLVFD